jgi:hypothetical protein
MISGPGEPQLQPAATMVLTDGRQTFRIASGFSTSIQLDYCAAVFDRVRSVLSGLSGGIVKVSSRWRRPSMWCICRNHSIR